MTALMGRKVRDMTREEAITQLHWLKAELIKGTDLNEPLDMAIEALQADTVSREEHFEVLANKITDMEERGFVQVVRCKDCRHAHECHKSVQYTRNEPRTVTIGYAPIEWCSRGERREK